MARRVAAAGIFAALALICSYVESFIPFHFGVPGIKLGLANIVTVWALMAIGPADAFGILICRIILGGIFTGNFNAIGFICALALLGGMIYMLFFKKYHESTKLTEKLK